MNKKSRRLPFILSAIALVAVLITANAVLGRSVSEKTAFSLRDLSKTGQNNFSYEDSAFVILALDDRGPTLTGQAVVNQIHTFMSDCNNDDSSNNEGFATGPNDLFPPAGIDNCPTPGLVNLHSAWVIVASGSGGSALTEQGFIEQMRASLDGCDSDDTSNEDGFATGPNDLFPPAGIKNCPIIIRLP